MAAAMASLLWRKFSCEPQALRNVAPPAVSGNGRAGRALRTSAFYLLNADTLVGWMFGAGIGFHMVSIINVSNGGSDVDVALHVYAHCPQGQM